IAASIVVVDHFFERREASVVHIRSGAGDLAQRRNLEGAAVLGLGRNAEAPGVARLAAGSIVNIGNSGVVEALVGEIRTGVAGDAASFAAEYAQPGAGFGGERLRIAVSEAVVRRIARYNGAHEAGERTCDLVRFEASASLDL